MWIKENPGVVLPRKTSEVARITRVSPNQVKTYLYRRRRLAKSMMRAILRYAPRLPLPLEDDQGRALTSYMCQRIEFHYDHWSLVVKLTLRNAIGEDRVVPVPDLEYFYDTVMKAAGSAGLIPSTSESSSQP